MTVQSSMTAIPGGERTIFASTVLSFVGAINERGKTLVARFMTALDESKRREADRLIRRYQHLIDDPKR
jgi:hypothetical protein